MLIILKMNCKSSDQQFPFSAYASVLEIREEWETGMEYLEKFFADGEQYRLVWHFTLNEAGWDLRPVEQKMGKSGWSKGKQIACDKLEYKDYLTELDRQILNCVVYQSGNYIEWSSNTVLELVARHPMLYDLYDQDASVSIEVDESGICLEESEQFLFWTYLMNIVVMILKRLGPYQYRYYKFPDFFDEIKEKLGEEGLKIPKNENTRLRELLPKISRRIPVMSQWRDEENKGQITEAFQK